MKYIIWGAGQGGEKIMNVLGVDNIVAYIDSNKEKQGAFYFDRPVISFETYLESYTEYFIIVAVWRVKWIREILARLRENNIHQYFYIFDAPQEVFWTQNTLPFCMDDIVGEKLIFSKYEYIAIYGVNIFSLMLYDFLVEREYKNVYLISDREKNFQELLQKRESKYRFLMERDVELIDRVLLTSKKVDEITFHFANCKIEDFYNFSYQLPVYRHDELKRFNGIHRGKRCFIIGNGPSLRVEDLQSLHKHGEFSIGCNYIYKTFPMTDWRPTYYAAFDVDVTCKELAEAILSLNLPEIFVPDKYIQSYFWRGKKGGYNQYHTLFEGPLVEFSKEKLSGFSADISKVVYSGVTVVYVMLQLAVYMGFSEIYLLGTDCGSSKTGVNKRMHFIDEYDSFGDEYYAAGFDAGYLTNLYYDYQAAKRYAEKHNISIYNATRGGNLEVFERVDFDEIINN